MRINPKQQQLVDEVFNKTKKQFPEISFSHLECSPDDPNHIWVIVNADIDDERLIELYALTSALQTDILSDYGYPISIMVESTDFALA